MEITYGLFDNHGFKVFPAEVRLVHVKHKPLYLPNTTGNYPSSGQSGSDIQVEISGFDWSIREKYLN